MLQIKHLELGDYEGIDHLIELKRKYDSERIGRALSFNEAYEQIDNWVYAKYDIIIGYVDDIPVGYTSGVRQKGLYKSIEIFTKKGQRKKGYGTILKQNQVDLARSLGFKMLVSTLTRNNKASKKVQENVGGIIGRNDWGLESIVYL